MPSEAGTNEQNQIVRYGNAGQVFAPYATKQDEAGAKFDFGTLGATVAAYRIAQPNIVDVDTDDPLVLLQTLDGEQRNRGVEVSVFGEPLKGLRLLSSVAFRQARLTKTQDGLLDGKTVEGRPKRTVTFNVDYALPPLPGLTLQGSVVWKSRQFTNQPNTQQLRAWAVADLGVSYRLPTMRAIVVQALATNVFDKQYGASSERGYLAYGDPRTYRVTASIDF